MKNIQNLMLCGLVTVFFCGCTNYSRVIQLTPQKTSGWKMSHELNISKCSDVEVFVRPVIISYEDSGIDIISFPMQTSGKEFLNDSNKSNPSVEVTFKHWYRDQHLESCSLSFVEIENENSAKRIYPISVQKFTAGEHVTKYSTVCTYSFEPNEFLGDKFDLYINESALGCKFEPIPSVYEKQTYHTLYEWM